MPPHQIKEAIRRRDAGDETVCEIARSYNIGSQHDFEVGGSVGQLAETRLGATCKIDPPIWEAVVSAPTGTMYDGLGKRLKGDGRGPESALELLASIEYKALLHDSPHGNQSVQTVESDRFYLVPEELERTQGLPLSWMAELAQVIADGGCVGVLAHRAETLAMVSDFLSRPDVVLDYARRAAGATQRQTGMQRVGVLCDGTGKYLDGDKGEAVAWQADEERQFRGFLNGSGSAKARSGLLPTDRLYIMPADYLVAGALPLWIMAELMKTLHRGGKVLVIAPTEEAFSRLVKIVSEPEKLMLAVQDAAGHA